MAIGFAELISVIGPLAVQILSGLKGAGVDVDHLTGTTSDGDLQILKDLADQEKAGFTDRENLQWTLKRFLKWDDKRLAEAMCPPGCSYTGPGDCDLVDPSEPPTGPSDPGGAIVDFTDPTKIKSLDGTAAEALSWPIVSHLSVTVKNGQMFFDYDYVPGTTCSAGQPVAGNFWIGRQVGGQYVFAPFEWFFPGQKNVMHQINWSDPGHNINGQLSAPVAGENLIWMVSGCARVGLRSSAWRTAICSAPWG